MVNKRTIAPVDNSHPDAPAVCRHPFCKDLPAAGAVQLPNRSRKEAAPICA